MKIHQYLAVGALALAGASATHADINLEMRTETPVVAGCDTIRVGLYAVSDDVTVQQFSAVQVIFTWDPAEMSFTGLDDTDALFSESVFSIPQPDPWLINEADPPADGDGMFVGVIGDPGQLPLHAPPQGVLLMTFEFQACATAAAAEVGIAATAGQNDEGETIVFDPDKPNTHVTGLLIPDTVQITSDCDCEPVELTGGCCIDAACQLETQADCEALGGAYQGDGTDCGGDPCAPACVWDIFVPADNMVNAADLSVLLDSWGKCKGCPADFDGNGMVDASDLAELLDNWGQCP